MSYSSVPFKAESGLNTVNGVAKFSHAGIVLEFESKLFGMFGSGVREVRLPLEDILDVRFRKGLFKRGAKIEIRTRSMSKLSELPNSDGKFTMKILSDDHQRAEAAAAQLQRDLAGFATEAIPARSPVGQLFDDDKDTNRMD